MAGVADRPDGIWLRADDFQAMRAHVERCSPEEACGLVAGLGGRSVAVFPVTNVLRSRQRFRMDPRQQIDRFNELERRRWELLAIYHSHPDGPDAPSNIDVREAAYPAALHLIWSRRGGDWRCRAFRIRDQRVEEVPIHDVPVE